MKNKIFLWVAILVVVVAAIWIWQTMPPAEVPSANSNVPAAGANPENVAPSTTNIPAGINVVGNWKSNEDAKYEISFAADNTFTELYNGAKTDSGTWHILTDLGTDSGKYGTLGLSGTFLKLDRTDGPYFYKILSATSTLDLIYLDHGNTLSFSREAVTQ